MPDPSDAFLAAALASVERLDLTGVTSVELAIDPEEKELRLVVVDLDMEEGDYGEPLPFRFRGEPHPVVLFLMSPAWRKTFAAGEGTWPTGWGSPPTLWLLYGSIRVDFG